MRFFARSKIKLMLSAAVLLVVAAAFFPFALDKNTHAPCDPKAVAFRGYTFLHPGIVKYNAAYAPFFLEFSDMYKSYFKAEIQREDNLEEWRERFCSKAEPKDVAQVVYDASIEQMAGLYTAAGDEEHKSPLPYQLAGNTFAEIIAYNGCTEAVAYLMFAKKCEPHVSGVDGWDFKKRDRKEMQELIQEGKGRFKQTNSHFIKLRYAYQIVRLAHYCHEWQQTVDLYNELMPQVDRRKPSIVFYWTLGHLAGALQKLGKNADAAYRFALIFRNCPSKRQQAYRSFYIKNDEQWESALKMCQSDSEKATLYTLRAGGTHTYAVEDIAIIYQLDHHNPNLDLLLVSDVQQLEKIFLRTPVTDKKYGVAEGSIRREQGAKHLLALQKFVRQVIKEGKIPNLKLWRMMDGYLELLAGDQYAAEKSFKNVEQTLEPDNTETNDKNLSKQLEVWRGLLQLLSIDASDKYAEDAAFRVKSLSVFKEYPGFEPFLQDWMASRYAENDRPGKAFMAAYDLNTLALNPSLPILDDLLEAATEKDPSRGDIDITNDTNLTNIEAQVLEIKGTYLFANNQPEAALATYRLIPATARGDMKKFSPFKTYINDCLRCPIATPELLTRMDIVERLGTLEFDAKAAAATGEPDKAANNYYLIGLGHYNMSWFGYEWEVKDAFRDGDNWARLSKGPVFPMSGAPLGNLENTDLTLALSYFEKALSLSKDDDLSAKAAFMAAKCQQKQWFCSPECKYRPGSRQIPVLPDPYNTYYNLLKKKYTKTSFYEQVVKECKWFAAYSRRN